MHMCLVLFKRFVDSSPPPEYFVYPQLVCPTTSREPPFFFPIQLTIRALVEKCLGLFGEPNYLRVTLLLLDSIRFDLMIYPFCISNVIRA